MTPKEAIKLVEKSHPGLYATGNICSYKNWYIIELSDTKKPEYIPIDSSLKIDKRTKEITPYIPFVDGIPTPSDRMFIDI